MPDYYDDAPEQGEGQAPEAEGGEQSQSKTALLPKHCFPDAKPGDTISVKVVSVHQDELEVEPQGCEKGEEQEQPQPDNEQPTGDMRSMLED